MTKVNIAEFKKQISKYVDQAASGEEILIARRNVPIAKLEGFVPARTKNRSKMGCMKGTVKYLGDVISPALTKKEWGSLA